MIQLNLLPEVKLEYLKAQTQRNLALSVAVLACAVSIGILVLLYSFGLLQNKHLNDLSKDISANVSTLTNKPDINKILTVQNQLKSLTQLHAKKPAASRIFTFMNQVTPSNVDIASVKTDFTGSTMQLSGSADSLSSVNKYVDTLKFTTFTTDTQKTSAKAFKNIVLSSFSLGSSNTAGHAASYSISMGFDPIIYDITQQVTLKVPDVTTTRASVDQPTDLFQPAATPTTTTKGAN